MFNYLAPYPPKLKTLGARIIGAARSYLDIGANVKHLGRVVRYYNPKSPDYRDPLVEEFLNLNGFTVSDYETYSVVPTNDEYVMDILKRYDRNPDPFENDVELQALYEAAGYALDKEFGPFVGGSRIRSLPTVCELLPVRKSPGWPFTLMYAYKEDMYGDNYDSPETGVDWINEYWRRLATTDPIWSFCSVSIKEELRPTAKVLSGSWRTIVAMACDNTICSGSLNGDHNDLLLQANGRCSSSLGLQLGFGHWDEHVNRHRRFGGIGKKCTLSLDGVKFDSTHHGRSFSNIRRFRYRCLRPEFRTLENYHRMRNIYEQNQKSPLVGLRGDVWDRSSANPSGQFCTTPDNIYKMYMDLFTIWCLVCPADLANWESFTTHVLLSINGDDVWVTVVESAQHFFNAEAIARCGERLGTKYEFENNGEFRDASECTFLGHRSIKLDIPGYDYTMWVPTPDCNKMRSSMLMYNELGTIAGTIIRACALRMETWACTDCRHWFDLLITFLRDRYRNSVDEDIINAWKSYKTDEEIFTIYTGIDLTGAYAISPSNKMLFEPVEMYCSPPISSDDKTPTMSKVTEKIIVKKDKGAPAAKKNKEVVKIEAQKSSKPNPPKSEKNEQGISGKGNYLVPIASNLGSAIGGLFGSKGSELGGALGGLAGVLGSKFFGLGDYRLQHKVAKAAFMADGPASMKLSARIPAFKQIKSTGGVLFDESECIGSVSGNPSSTSPVIYEYSVNPGLVSTFPVLAAKAANYAQYKVRGMVVAYRRMAGQGTSVALGGVAMSAQFDPEAAPPTSMMDIENNQYGVSTTPDESEILLIECDPKRINGQMRYIRKGTPLSPSDLRTDDWCNFYIGVQGTGSGYIGELWISYIIECFNENVTSIGSGYSGHSAASYPGTAGLSANFWLNQYWINKPGSSIWPSVFPPFTGTTPVFSMPKVAGHYCIQIFANGISLSFAAGFGTLVVSGGGLSGDITPLNIFNNDTNWVLGWVNAYQAAFIFTFSYVPTSSIPTADFKIPFPYQSSGSETIQVDMLLTRLDSNLTKPFVVDPVVKATNDIKRQLGLLPPSASERLKKQEGETTYQVVADTVTDGQHTIQQFPYTGPIPPPSSTIVEGPSSSSSSLNTGGATSSVSKDEVCDTPDEVDLGSLDLSTLPSSQPIDKKMMALKFLLGG